MAQSRLQTALGKVFPFFDQNKNGYDRLVNSVASDDLHPSTIQIAEISIPAASVLTLRATPYTLVAAPGAGYVNEFISASLILDYGTTGYTESTANLAVKFTDGSGAQVSETIEMTGFIDQTADTKTTARAKLDAIVAKTGCDNKALVLHNLGAGEFGNSGDSVLRLKVAYRVVPTGW